MFLPVIILLISIFFPSQDKQIPEQVATDYFFENILKQDFPEYNVIEFNRQTQTDGYYGIIHNCEDYDELLIKEIINAVSGSSIQINAKKCLVKVKKNRKHSSRLQINVSSKIDIDGRLYVYITASRKLRFVEHYFLTLNKDNLKVLNVCKVGEII